MTVLEEKDYLAISKLMRDLMAKWKSERKTIKEISMPDVMDIIGNGNSSFEDVISKYWIQIKESEDEELSSYIIKAMAKHSSTVFMLADNRIIFDKETNMTNWSKWASTVYYYCPIYHIINVSFIKII